MTGVSSRLLSRQLLQAAKQLLYARRAEEAYWLLAECLQEDPDCVEALQMMERFPDLTRGRKRQRSLIALAVSIAFAFALVAAFRIGKRTEREHRFPTVPSEAASRLFLLPSHPAAGARTRTEVEFKEAGKAISRISATLFLMDANRCDTLYMDAKAVSLPPPAAGLSLDPGEHSLVCLDGAGALVYREKSTLLPFQRKVIRIRSATPRKEA